MLQTLIVGLIVAGAALYSVWALMPRALREAAAARLARQAVRDAAAARRAERQQSALAGAAGCSDCSSCKGCSTPGTEAAWQPVSLPARRKP